MSDVFCQYLLHQLRFEYNEVSPCCWISKKSDLNNINDYRKWLTSLTGRPKECIRCIESEDKGIESHRQRANRIPKVYGFDGSADNKITAIEFQIDADCNGACITCGEFNSTTWAKYNANNSANVKFNIDQRRKFNTKQRLQKALEKINGRDLSLITFLGGEPLINQEHVNIVKSIYKDDPLNNVTLKYITNGSQYPDLECLELWKQAKKIILKFSIDGIDEQFNYHRWPLQWHQVNANINKLLAYKLPNVSCGLSVTLTPFNLFYYDTMDHWAKNLASQYPEHSSTFVLDFCHAATGIVNLECVPDKLQHALKEKYGPDHRIVKMLLPFNQQRYNQFMEYINFHDKKRNQSWKKVFPEIVDFFK